MSEARDKQYREFFTETLSSELQKAISQATGASWTVSESDKPGSGLSATPQALYRLTLKGDLSGACCLQFAAEESKALTDQIMAKTPATKGDPLLGMLENAVTEFMLALIAEYGEVEVSVEPAPAVGPGDMDVVPLRASSGNTLVSMVLYIEPALSESMVRKAQKAASAGVPSAEQPSQQQMESLSQRTGIDESKLKLILDVELNLLLRFGQRQLTLREILDLNAGSVIELDRQVDEPIELLLDGRVIARGEAVVVDGNYGLRVTEVPQPMASQLTH